ncbi:MAG: hypothetical protein KF887_15075 [Paracoccaceae bacterium]|nr:MAG: hypothetical protein KF887_15075 [Paracoccaceae bacterium]
MTDRTQTERPVPPRRWLAAVIAATAAPETLPALPFQRGNRRRPAGLSAVATPRPTAIAAR